MSRTIDRFLLHKAPSKHRIFALVLDGGTEELEAVATLHKDDLHLSSELLGAMMTTLGTGDPTPVEETLESLPEAVAAGVRQYLPSDHAPEPGSRRYSGALNSSLNKIFVPDEPSDFDRGQISALLEAAWTIPVAVRADNMITEEGGLYWRVHFFQEVPFIEDSEQEPRSWALPDGVPLNRTLINDDLDEVWDHVVQAADEGKWVRIHLSEHDPDDEGIGDNVWLVDIFDAPPPPISDERADVL